MIILWYVVLVISLRGFQDSWLRKAELIYWDKNAYDAKASRIMSFAEFTIWYIFVILCLLFITDNFWQGFVTLTVIAIWHLLCGVEDFLCYFFEPIFKHPRRDERYQVKFWIWRFPKELHWLGEGDNVGHEGWFNPLLMLVAGRRVQLKGFLMCIITSVAITAAVSFIWSV